MKHKGLTVAEWLALLATGAFGLNNLDANTRAWTRRAFEAAVAALRQVPEVNDWDLEAYDELARGGDDSPAVIRYLLACSARIALALPEAQQGVILAIVKNRDADWAAGGTHGAPGTVQ